MTAVIRADDRRPRWSARVLPVTPTLPEAASGSFWLVTGCFWLVTGAYAYRFWLVTGAYAYRFWLAATSG